MFYPISGNGDTGSYKQPSQSDSKEKISGTVGSKEPPPTISISSSPVAQQSESVPQQLLQHEDRDAKKRSFDN
jgi:hypothetical protein